MIVSRVLPVVLGFYGALRELGHEPVALLTIRFGGFEIGGLLNDVPDDLSVLVPARRSDIAPLLASVEPDLVTCMGFPWKVPADALAVPRLGWLNGHPSLLPNHRGPVPVAWAVRHGDPEYGITFHRMDAEFDTGPIYAQRRVEMGEYDDPDVFYPRMGPAMIEAFGEAVQKLDAGEPGEPQPEGGSYETFFTDEDATLDLTRPREEVHRLVWGWRFMVPVSELRGALTELDGETVRVLATSLTEVEGARRIECGDGPLWVTQTEPVTA